MSGMELSKTELCKFYGVTANTISQWVSKGCPWISQGGHGKKWRFCSAEVTRWREEQIAAAAQGDTSNLDYEEARRRKLAAEAGMAELELSKQRGEVIEIELVADQVGEQFSNLRAKLLSIPTKLAPNALGLASVAEARALIESVIVDALEELTADEFYSGEGSTAGDFEEATESKAAA